MELRNEGGGRPRFQSRKGRTRGTPLAHPAEATARTTNEKAQRALAVVDEFLIRSGQRTPQYASVFLPAATNAERIRFDLQAGRWLLLRACARPQVSVRVGLLLGQTGAMRDVPLD
jgi:hypothetical protein